MSADEIKFYTGLGHDKMWLKINKDAATELTLKNLGECLTSGGPQFWK
jgi:hypothetical protein